MPRSYLLRLSDMLDAIEQIQKVIHRGSFAQYEDNRDYQMIVERGFEILSEASRHLPLGLKQRNPDIPWKKVAGIGNLLRHEYHRITQSALWKTACDDLPKLVEVCQAELKRGKPD